MFEPFNVRVLHNTLSHRRSHKLKALMGAAFSSCAMISQGMAEAPVISREPGFIAKPYDAKWCNGSTAYIIATDEQNKAMTFKQFMPHAAKLSADVARACRQAGATIVYTPGLKDIKGSLSKMQDMFLVSPQRKMTNITL